VPGKIVSEKVIASGASNLWNACSALVLPQNKPAAE
jgi:hypothetical protein